MCIYVVVKNILHIYFSKWKELYWQRLTNQNNDKEIKARCLFSQKTSNSWLGSRVWVVSCSKRKILGASRPLHVVWSAKCFAKYAIAKILQNFCKIFYIIFFIFTQLFKQFFAQFLKNFCKLIWDLDMRYPFFLLMLFCRRGCRMRD